MYNWLSSIVAPGNKGHMMLMKCIASQSFTYTVCTSAVNPKVIIY